MHETMLRDHLEQLLSRLDRVGAATTMLRESESLSGASERIETEG